MGLQQGVERLEGHLGMLGRRRLICTQLPAHQPQRSWSARNPPVAACSLSFPSFPASLPPFLSARPRLVSNRRARLQIPNDPLLLPYYKMCALPSPDDDASGFWRCTTRLE